MYKRQIQGFGYSVAHRGFRASFPKPGPGATRAYRDAYSSGGVFYKEATPKAEHFMQFRVTLPKSLQNVISGDSPRVELKLYAIDASGERVVVVRHGVEIR